MRELVEVTTIDRTSTATGAMLVEKMQTVGDIALRDKKIGRQLQAYLTRLEKRARWSDNIYRLAIALTGTENETCTSNGTEDGTEDGTNDGTEDKDTNEVMIEIYPLANTIAKMLDRFDGSVGYRRCKLGHRKANLLESIMLDILDCDGPACAKSIALELREKRNNLSKGILLFHE